MSLRYSSVKAGAVEVGTAAHEASLHHDVAEEYFTAPEIIFTIQDRWRIRGRRGEVMATPRVLVLGNAGEPYACRHFDPVPQDRTLYVRFTAPVDGVADLPSPLFTEQGLRAQPYHTACLGEMRLELATRSPGFRMKLEGLAYGLLVEVVRSLHDMRTRCVRTEPPAGRWAVLRVDTARDFIDRHFADDLDLSTIASVAGLSPFHFARLFKARTQTSPHQYVLRRRLEDAARQLRNTARSVTEIALSTGFQDSRHFARAFRRFSGLVPTAYRHRPGAGSA